MLSRRPIAITLLLLACALAHVCADKAGGDASVSIANKKFDPASVKITAGDTVTWTNSDDHDHTVVADDGSFKSGNIGSGQTFAHKFKKPGTYSYSCTYHPRMKGSVIVASN